MARKVREMQTSPLGLDTTLMGKTFDAEAVPLSVGMWRQETLQPPCLSQGIKMLCQMMLGQWERGNRASGWPKGAPRMEKALQGCKKGSQCCKKAPRVKKRHLRFITWRPSVQSRALIYTVASLSLL